MFFFFQAEDGIRDHCVTGVQTCALPISVFATLRGSWRCATDPKRTADEYVVWLTQLMAFDGLRREDIDAAILSSVVPATIFNLKTLCRRYFNCDPLVVGEKTCRLGIKVLLDRPEE